MTSWRLAVWKDERFRIVRLLLVPTVLALVALVFQLARNSGGCSSPFVHAMYVPILLASFAYGVRGGVLVGVIGGIALGPFMPPADPVAHAASTWVSQLGFFVLLGGLAGLFRSLATAHFGRIVSALLRDRSTQLPNRRALHSRLHEIAGSRRPEEHLVVAVVLFENAMELKAVFGFESFEHGIQQSAVRFASVLDGKSQVFRTSTDQLAILLRPTQKQPMEPTLEEITEAARLPFRVDGVRVHVDARIGYVTQDETIDLPEALLQQAEIALVSAVQKAEDRVSYHAGLSTGVRENISIIGDLKEAINSSQLELFYQPKISIASGEVLGLEALLRWRHPLRGLVPPSVFIPRAEQSTLIHLITEFTLEQAVIQSLRFREHGIEVPIAVNISPRGILRPGFAESVIACIEHHGLRGESLELEITEGALMTDLDRILGELNRLSDAEITLSIDDFGTGYSSLQYLDCLPISSIKIDQSFIRRIADDRRVGNIVEATVVLAHRLGMRTVAEGVESNVVLEHLAEMGCDLAQGFFISKPLPVGEFIAWQAQYQGASQVNYR